MTKQEALSASLHICVIFAENDFDAYFENKSVA